MQNIMHQLAEKLLARGARLVTIESCTGGGIASAITSRPGSSDWFDRGWVTYSNEAKSEMVDVDPVVISQFGAV
ncbi:MAG: nicotinamide-nucleotide amidase, partial [Gammaproteobacteria bacterium]